MKPRLRLVVPEARQGPGDLPAGAVARLDLVVSKRAAGVLPGLMNTPLVQKVARQFASETTGKDYEAFVNRRHNQVPMGHMGTGWDIAHAVLFLVSDEAKYITATEIVVDGGFTAD